jgi:hypothetical protein
MGRKRPRDRIHLIHFKPEAAQAQLRVLRSAGFSPVCTEFRPDLVRHLANKPPAAVIIDLTRLPASGRDVGVLLRRAKGTRDIPLVFAGGGPEKVARVRAVLSDAEFSGWDTIGTALRRAIRMVASAPVVPASALAGYSGTPLLRKLGIEAGTTVRLVNAPANIASILGPLPAGVSLATGRGDRDLTLWFVTSRSQLERRVGTIAGLLRGGHLWIAWPKRASGVSTDVTQTDVRRSGLAHGLVDFKICAIDAVWSGLKFVARAGK